MSSRAVATSAKTVHLDSTFSLLLPGIHYHLDKFLLAVYILLQHTTHPPKTHLLIHLDSPLIPRQHEEAKAVRRELAARERQTRLHEPYARALARQIRAHAQPDQQ